MRKRRIGTRSALRGRKRKLLLARKARVKRGLGRKRRSRKVVYFRTGVRRGKKRIRRKLIRRVQVITPPVQVIPAVEIVPPPPPQVQQVVPLPPDLGVAPETPPEDAFQQGYTEAYNVGFDAGFAKGFEDGHKLELG